MSITIHQDPALMPPPPTMASPNWWGADSERQRARDEDGTAVFIKQHTEYAREYLDLPSVVAITKKAGEIGLGPRTLSAVEETSEILMEDLTETHSTATMADFQDVEVLEQYLQVRKQVWTLEVPSLRTATIFDDIRSLQRRLGEKTAGLPEDVKWLYGLVAEIEDVVEALGRDTAAIHGDANCSNVALKRGDHAALLLDFDWAAKSDPLQDVGSALLEFGLTEYQSRDIFELFWGTFDEGLYCRARLYAGAEALRGGLLGAWLDRVAPGTEEYSKFADWMFLRARLALSAHVTDDHLRRVK